MAACRTKKSTLDQMAEGLAGAGENPTPFVKYFNTNIENIAENVDKDIPEAGIKYTVPDKDPNIQDSFTEAMVKGNKYFADVIAARLTDVAPTSLNFASKVDAAMRSSQGAGPIYADTLDMLTGVWTKNKQVQVIRQYVNPNSDFLSVFNKLKSIEHNAKQEQLEVLQKAEAEVGKLFEEAYTQPAAKKKANTLFAEIGIFGIATNGMLADIVEGKSTVEASIALIEGRLPRNKENKQIAEDLASIYIGKDVKGKRVKANLEAYGFVMGKDVYSDMQALVALYGMRNVPSSEAFMRDAYNNKKELYTELIKMSISAKAISDRLASQEHIDGQKQVNSQKGNLVEDVGPIDYHLKAVSYKEAMNNSTLVEENGWKVLRKPVKDGEMGIYYRENTAVVKGGIGANISYVKTGVPISPDQYVEADRQILAEDLAKLAKENSIFERDDSRGNPIPTLSLTSAERATLGYLDSPVTSLIRSYAHNKLLLETQVIRDTFSNSFTRNFKEVGTMAGPIMRLIEKDDHPPFIGLSESFIYDELDPEIKALYEPVNKTILSDVGSFKNNAQLVRKDFSEQLLGYSAGQTFGNNHKANLYHKRAKDFVRWLKINTIVLNAPKIAMDIGAGMAIASAKGASLQEIIKYSKEAYNGNKELSALRNKKVKHVFDRASLTEGSPSYIAKTKAISNLDDEIAKHPFSPALANGFIQSLGTELLNAELSSPQGLQATIEGVIRKYMVKDGESTPLNEAIKYAANLGGETVALDSLYLAAADAVKNKTKYQSEAEVLESFGNRLRGLKSHEDMTGYISELVAAPNSSLVHLGGAATLMADMLPRWIIYKHNLNNGMSEKAATEDALLALLDYKTDLPSSLQFLSDLYILPYPSFFVRIQRVIINLGAKSPVSVAAQLTFEEVVMQNLGMQGGSIFNSNIIEKVAGGNLISNPFELITPPYWQLFGF